MIAKIEREMRWLAAMVGLAQSAAKLLEAGRAMHDQADLATAVNPVVTSRDIDAKLHSYRGRSSAGRASRSQCEGQGFDPPRLHQQRKD
jgi:hypothetical protein